MRFCSAKLSFLLSLSLALFSFQISAQELATVKMSPSGDLVRGCYSSVEEYVNNNPSIKDSIVIEKEMRTQKAWEGTYNATLRYADNGKRIKKIWGYSDGEKAYIFHQNEYFEIETGEDEISFEGYEFFDPSSSTTWGVVGGAIGGAIAQSIAVSKAKEKKVRYKIDLSTGWAIHSNPDWNRPIPVEYVVLYRPKKKETDTPVSFVVNDSLTLSFGPSSYHLMKLPEGSQSVKIAWGPEFSSNKTFELDADEIDYLKATQTSALDESQVVRVSESEGEYYSFKAYQAQERRNKKNR